VEEEVNEAGSVSCFYCGRQWVREVPDGPHVPIDLCSDCQRLGRRKVSKEALLLFADLRASENDARRCKLIEESLDDAYRAGQQQIRQTVVGWLDELEEIGASVSLLELKKMVRRLRAQRRGEEVSPRGEARAAAELAKAEREGAKAKGFDYIKGWEDAKEAVINAIPSFYFENQERYVRAVEMIRAVRSYG
jgi:hypothetical protein